MHLIKLCVGAESIEDLADWQAKRLKEKRKKRQKPELIHVTRQTPKQADALLDGGSLYWVIKGWIAVRQPLVELRPMSKEGVPHCGLVLGPELIPVARRPCRAFQGWRYLKPKDAPKDVPRGALGLPEELQRELAELGLL